MRKTVIIGGGAAGMTCALLLARKGENVTILERGERLGRKLSATGNGQGNVTNIHMDVSHFFSDDICKAERALSRFSERDTVALLESMGGIFLPDSRGRVYPAGRQASAVTDLFRRALSELGVNVCFSAQVQELSHNGKFTLKWAGGQMCADAVVLAAGGAAAPQFGTDGTAYALVKKWHKPTPLAPSLVQLKCDPALVRGLKGIRTDSVLRLLRDGKPVYETRGDVLFTEGGISGDAVFRASAHAHEGDTACIDFLPDVPCGRVEAVVKKSGLYCVVNNGLGRFLEKRAKDPAALAGLIKGFPLPVTGANGMRDAQVTKGGIPLAEVDDNMRSKKCAGLYFAGEILNVDGECGGYNLQWAFTSAYCAAEGILCS